MILWSFRSVFMWLSQENPPLTYSQGFDWTVKALLAKVQGFESYFIVFNADTPLTYVQGFDW